MPDAFSHKYHRALIDALRAAGGIIKKGFHRPFRVGYKGDINIVTSVDKAAERAVLKLLKSRFPDHGFLMEESGERSSRSGHRWIVDPLDGTVNFAHGIPICCVSIGLEKDGKILMGGVYDPFREEMFSAALGKGAALNGRRIRVSQRKKLIESVLATGFPYDSRGKARLYLSFVEKFMRKTRGLRRLGSAALDMSYVACGRFDGYWEFNIKPWDASAGWLLVEEAGGRVTDFRGRAYSLDDTSQTLCSNGLIHPAMLRAMSFPS